MPNEIESYKVGWQQASGKGVVQVKLKGQPNLHTLNVSANELAAIMLILQQSPVYVENGYIHTGVEFVL